MRKLLGITLLLIHVQLNSQSTVIGAWTDHLSYAGVQSLTFDGSKVYCGTNSGIYSYNLTDHSLERYSTINVLTDIGIQINNYHAFTNTLCVYYNNGNIDFIQNGKTTNVAFFQEHVSINDKTINSIYNYNEFSYLACNFGIIKINVAKKEISETYMFGNSGSNMQVNAVSILDNNIYAATQNGLFKANLNSNLLDFNAWEKLSSLTHNKIQDVFAFDQFVFVLTNDTGQAILKLSNGTWSTIPELITGETIKKIKSHPNELQVAYDNSIREYDKQFQEKNKVTAVFSSLSDFIKVGEQHYFVSISHSYVWEFRNNSYQQTINPTGPQTKDAFDISANNGKVWVVKGGYNSSYGNQFQSPSIYFYDGSRWKTFTSSNNNTLQNKYDVVKVTPNPNKDGNLLFSTWGTGLIEVIDYVPQYTIDNFNSSLTTREDAPGSSWVGSGGAEFDSDGNLWVGNSYSTQSISVRKSDGSWKNFDFSGYLAPSAATADIVISKAGYKWLVSPRDNSIVVFDDNGTIDATSDDRKVRLSTGATNGQIPGNRGLTIAVDKNDDVWLGTDEGLAIFYNATNIFENYTSGAKPIIIKQGENNEELFHNQSIKDIEVDGANRKWIATESNGVYLMSPDGKKKIYHFTVDNSPLFSDNIFSLSIDHKTGEVYIGTDQGILSFRAEATEGSENYNEVSIYPNPVRPDYSGPIAINGLIENSVVKITDISGTLINEIRSLGGQAIWNGNNFNGERAKTGVYLIFNSALDKEDNLKTHVGKILFVN